MEGDAAALGVAVEQFCKQDVAHVQELIDHAKTAIQQVRRVKMEQQQLTRRRL